MENITKEDFQDPDNLWECECGNHAHFEYMASDDEGRNSCPSCHQSFLSGLIHSYRRLLLELVDPALSKADINARVAAELAESMGISPEEFRELDMAEQHLFEG